MEWVLAAGGEEPVDRYPWDVPGKVTTDEKEIVRRANVKDSGIGHSTPVNAFLRGVSPLGVKDMAGNVTEWQANYSSMKEGWIILRGGSWYSDMDVASVSHRDNDNPDTSWGSFGFRVLGFSGWFLPTP